VNIGTSKTKSKPRKSRGRGGLPPPSYQHNLAPTFVTQQATDYNPVIGAIASLTAKLNEQPRIQQPVTPLSSTVQATSQSAEQMAGEAALRRAGHTAANLQPLPSQADERLSMSMEDRQPVRAPDPIIRERLVKDDKAWDRGGIPEATAYVKRGRPFKRATQSFPLNQTYLIAQDPRAEADSSSDSSSDSSVIVSSDSSSDSSVIVSSDLSSDSSSDLSSDIKRPADEYFSADENFTERLLKPKNNFQRLPSEQRAPSSVKLSSDSEGPAAGGGGLPKGLARARQKAKERQGSIREKIKRGEPITTEERQFVRERLGLTGNRYQSSDDQPSTRQKSKGGKKIVVENI